MDTSLDLTSSARRRAPRIVSPVRVRQAPGASPRGVPARPSVGRPPLVDVVIPVHNEEHDLEPSVRRLRAFLDESFPFAARIVIADNASSDRTWPIALALQAELRGVTALHLDRRGRGHALRAAWLASDARVVAYMDVDLSTDLRALLPLVAPLLSGHSDVAIGSRLAPRHRRYRRHRLGQHRLDRPPVRRPGPERGRRQRDRRGADGCASRPRRGMGLGRRPAAAPGGPRVAADLLRRVAVPAPRGAARVSPRPPRRPVLGIVSGYECTDVYAVV